MTVWRLQTKTDSKDRSKIAGYCIENNVLAMGWSLKHLPKEAPEQAIQERNEIDTFEKYTAFIEKYNVYKKAVNANVKRFYYEVKENDLVWIRADGIYYLGRVTEKSHWEFNLSALDLDATNQITDIAWCKIGDESDVPGAITTAFIRGHTLQKINKPSILEYSQLIWNEKANEMMYADVELPKTAETFYSLLSPEDCEDLLCLWLYAKFGYIAIPSTNKKATECYECVLRDPKTGRNIYPQVKAGGEELDKKNYCHLNGEVWLFTSKGCVVGEGGDNIHVADPETLYEFAESEAAKKILSQSILSWCDMLENA